MVEALDVLRRTVASRPLWIWAALFLLASVLRRVRHRDATERAPARIVQVVSVLALFYYLGVVVWYAVIPQQSDYAEPTMTCVAWLFRIGKPVYHTLMSAERYSHMYGPIAFVVPGFALWLFGPSMVVGKAVGVVAALCALAFTWSAVRSVATARLTAMTCGVCVLEFLVFRNLTFWSRPEPLQLAAVAAGLLAATRLSGTAAAVVTSLAAGLLWNLKITGPLYSLPIFALLYVRSGIRPVVASAIGAAVVAVAPFVAFSNVSWSDYMLWVRLSARNGLRVAALKENLEWAVFLLIPVLARLSDTAPPSRAMRITIPALLLGICGVVVAASKPGAGAYHLVPFLPTLALVLGASLQEQAATASSAFRWQTPFVLTLMFVVVIQQQYFFRTTIDPAVRRSYVDVAEYIRQHPGERVAVGYTSAERMTFARTLTVFATGHYLIDVPAVQEHQLSGMELPPATFDAIRSCTVSTWLMPKAGTPFDIRNDYPSTGYRQIFSAEFIEVFEAAYQRDGRTEYYDVWRCRTK